MMQKTIYLAALLLIMSLSSCSNYVSCGSDKDAFLDNFYSFVEKVKNHQKEGEISDKDWESYDSQFKKLTEECYQQHEKDLETSDQMGVAYATSFYLYAKHGRGIVLKILQQDAAIRKILSEVDPMLLLNIGKEIFNNPEELRNIIKDLEKRYGN